MNKCDKSNDINISTLKNNIKSTILRKIIVPCTKEDYEESLWAINTQACLP